jgi:hypothetical protein
MWKIIRTNAQITNIDASVFFLKMKSQHLPKHLMIKTTFVNPLFKLLP